MDEKGRIGLTVAVIATMLATVFMFATVTAESGDSGSAPTESSSNAADCHKTLGNLKRTKQTRLLSGPCIDILDAGEAEKRVIRTLCDQTRDEWNQVAKENCEGLKDLEGKKIPGCTVSPRFIPAAILLFASCTQTGYDHFWTCTLEDTPVCIHKSECEKVCDPSDCLASCIPQPPTQECKDRCQTNSQTCKKLCADNNS